MRTYANWKSAVITLVAFGLVITQVESAALAQGLPASPPAAPQSQAPPPASAPPAKSPAKPRSGHRRFKWLLIGAAAVGAAVAVILIKNRNKPEPVVTIGGPTVGSPQ